MEQNFTSDDATQVGAVPSPLASDIDSSSSPRERKPHRRGRWIAGAIVVILLLILIAGGGGGYFAYRQYPALNAAGLRFCSDLLDQKYDDAYSLLSSRLRHRYSQAVFVSLNQTLDTSEGKAMACGQASSGAFHIGAFPLSVAVATELTRAVSGRREGNVTFLYENGRWLVDNMSTSLLSVNIDALLRAQSLCANLAIQAKTEAALSQKYASIWEFYGAAAQAQTTEADFIEIGRLHDELDGKVEECSITSIGKNNTDALTQVTYTARHTYSFETQASAMLHLEHGAWKFTSLDTSVYGRDMAPALATTKLLVAMASGDCSAAYANISADAQKRVTLALFTSRVCNAPVLWSTYGLDPTAYVEESPTKYTIDLIDISYDRLANLITLGVDPTVYYAGYVGVTFTSDAWRVDSMIVRYHSFGFY